MSQGFVDLRQRLRLLTALGENIDWDSLSPEEVQAGIREARRAGMETTSFIKSGFGGSLREWFRDTREVVIQIPPLPKPSFKEFKENCALPHNIAWLKSIKRDTSPTKAVTLRLGTVLELVPH